MSNTIKNCKIYYGDGDCSIEGDEIAGVIIGYGGDVIVETRATGKSWIVQGDSKIAIISMDGSPLTSLFKYSGILKILKAEVADNNSLLHTTLHRIDSYTEYINTNAEDLTTSSEELGKKEYPNMGQRPTEIQHPILETQNTETHDGKLYLENGTRYHGEFHIHFKDGSAMTGRMHTPGSQLLYTKLYMKNAFIDKLIPTTRLEAAKLIRMERNKMRSKSSIKKYKMGKKLRKNRGK